MKTLEKIQVQTTDSIDLSSCLLNERKTAEYLSVSQKTLQNWRQQGRGPRYIRLSAGAVRYRLSDLHTWIDFRCFQSTSEANQCA